MNTAPYSPWLDRFAIGLSGICALHCLALPLMLVLLPALGATFFGDEAFHRALLWLVIPLSVLAVWLGCLQHKDRRVWAFTATGLALMVVAALIGHDVLGEWGEKLVTLMGATVLSLGHIRNHALCRRVRCDHDRTCH
ncbi:MAG: MerC domain-containing protein [Oleiphilaceae bacterium]|nr:MerC domain-containing protein [Oleiphilaceae bacterium]